MPLCSALFLIGALLVASDYALYVQTCGNDVTKYLDCIDEKFWAAFEQQTELEMRNAEEEVNQCFTAYDCMAPPLLERPQRHGGEMPPFDVRRPHGPKDGRPPRPPPPFGVGPPPPGPPPPFEPPLPETTTAFGSPVPPTEVTPMWLHFNRSSFKEPFERFHHIPMFISKIVLNDEFFPASNGQELSETFGECMRSFEDRYRAILQECLREEMPGFVDTKRGIATQCSAHVQGGMSKLFHQRGALDGLERLAFDHLSREGTCPSNNVALARKCLSNTFSKTHKSSFDIMVKARDVKVLRCHIGFECLAERNAECKMDIGNFGRTACGCLAKQKDELVFLAYDSYERCTGFKPKRELVDDEIGSKIEMFCRNYEETENFCDGIRTGAN